MPLGLPCSCHLSSAQTCWPLIPEHSCKCRNCTTGTLFGTACSLARLGFGVTISEIVFLHGKLCDSWSLGLMLLWHWDIIRHNMIFHTFCWWDKQYLHFLSYFLWHTCQTTTDALGRSLKRSCASERVEHTGHQRTSMVTAGPNPDCRNFH